MKHTVKWLAFSCPHCPLQDEDAVAWCIDQIVQHKPDVVVHLGDGHEAAAASRHPHEHDWPLEHEYHTHNLFLREIRHAAGRKARLVMLPGNHDDHILRECRLPKALRSLTDYRRWEPELAYWRHRYRYEYCRTQVVRLGQVTFGHGWGASATSSVDEAVKLGVPFGLYVHGHTHRPNVGQPVQFWARARLPLPWWYANAGCLRDMGAEWMHDRDRQMWGQAIVVGSCDPRVGRKSPRTRPYWTAETRVFRFYNEWAVAKKG